MLGLAEGCGIGVRSRAVEDWNLGAVHTQSRSSLMQLLQ